MVQRNQRFSEYWSQSSKIWKAGLHFPVKIAALSLKQLHLIYHLVKLCILRIWAAVKELLFWQHLKGTNWPYGFLGNLKVFLEEIGKSGLCWSNDSQHCKSKIWFWENCSKNFALIIFWLLKYWKKLKESLTQKTVENTLFSNSPCSNENSLIYFR